MSSIAFYDAGKLMQMPPRQQHRFCIQRLDPDSLHSDCAGPNNNKNTRDVMGEVEQMSSMRRLLRPYRDIPEHLDTQCADLPPIIEAIALVAHGANRGS